MCRDQIQLVKHIKYCFAHQDIYIDFDRLNGYEKINSEYVPFALFEWQRFIICLHDCVFWSKTKRPRWPDLFAMIARGAGKDGTIAVEAMDLASPYNGIPEYDVDICANNEDQALRPVLDLIGFFNDSKQKKKLERFWKWLTESITSKKTGAKIRGRTNNPKGKDGMRSGLIVFNEIHQYADYKNINVFTTGLGKKPHPRTSYYTTNGDEREGPLDDLIADAEDILNNPEELEDNGMIPFLCRLDALEEVHNPKNWTKANPSLPYLPDLYDETMKEYKTWLKNPDRLPAFIQKRMNLIQKQKEQAVVAWDPYITGTNKPVPDMKGQSCSVGIDLAKTTDWAAVDLHFKQGDQRYDINHAWICGKSEDLHKIKAPWKKWVEKGDCTFVDEDEINPDLIAKYIKEMGTRYKIEVVCIDNYRYSIMSDALKKIGFSKENKNLILVSQTDILKIFPVIERMFLNFFLNWGDMPHLRWATNNTKAVPYGRNLKSADKDADKGSYTYAKIERKSRKTDPFMAFVAACVGEDRIKDRIKPSLGRRIKVISI